MTDIINTLNRLQGVESDPGSFYQDPEKYLGDFASRIDQTSERTYIENGYIRNVKPRSRKILNQTPQTTVLVKKKIISSVVENYDLLFMDSGEELFLKCTKILFKQKVDTIKAYEKLTKVENLVSQKGIIDDAILPIAIDALSSSSNFSAGLTIGNRSALNSRLSTSLQAANQLNYFSKTNDYTTWVANPDNPSDESDGTGVIEFTLVSSFSTNTSVKFGEGSASISFENPYNLLSINEDDIDRAIVTGAIPRNSILANDNNRINNDINDLKQQLNLLRLSKSKSPISFTTSPNSIIYKQVRAFIDEEGKEIIYSYSPGLGGLGAAVSSSNGVSLDPSATEGFNGISEDETYYVTLIIANIFQTLTNQSMLDRFISDLSTTNTDLIRDIEYARERMRLFYNGRFIISAQDVVHIFVKSDTREDDSITGVNTDSVAGNSKNLLSLFNTNLQNLSSIFNSKSDSRYGYEDVEKDVMLGPDFPNWLWKMFKNDYTNEAEGVQVFQGLVNNPTVTFSGGSYKLSCSCSDNTSYLKFGVVNFKPAVDVIDDELYDPLTPYDVDFESPEEKFGSNILKNFPLLSGNRELFNIPIFKAKSGPRRGDVIDSLGTFQENSGLQPTGNSYIQTYYDPDGFVYKWKKGIGTLTYNGPRDSTDLAGRSPLLTANPFAGQDIMNVISLLITGEPYNFKTFIDASIKNAGLSVGKGDPAGLSGYIKGVISDLRKNNAIWGNFIPFKRLILNEQAIASMVAGVSDIQKNDAELEGLLSRRAQLFDTLQLTSAGGESSVADAITEAAKQTLADLDSLIFNKQAETIQQQQAYKSQSLPVGQDQSVYGSETATLSLSDDDRETLRRRMNSVIQRRSWKVRSNTDNNLFVVDDQYDMNYDIQAFERKVGNNLSLFDSDYASPGEKISAIASILGLEVFADTQGNIQCRPPGYNKIPSSVFYNMLSDFSSGKRIFPKEFENLFLDQGTNLYSRLEVVELEIRLYAAALNYGTDAVIEEFLNGSENRSFKFLTNEDNFKFETALREIAIQASSDFNDPPPTVEFSALKQNLSFQLYDNQKKISLIREQSSPVFTTSDDILARYNRVSIALQAAKGSKVPDLSQIKGTGASLTITQSQALKVIGDISKKISERQTILLSLSGLLRNLGDLIRTNEDPKTRKALLYPNVVSKASIPKTIAHMIQDEETDDLGPGSGKRYVLKEEHIISLTINENTPKFTSIQVNGLFNEGFTPPVQGLTTGSGNWTSTAKAVNYDLWRMFGYIQGGAIEAKFLNDPDTQLVPFAVWLLNRERQNILTASATIVGNEYMQPGEVIYVESLNLLFYVEKVAHTFTYGTSFQTTLTLTYGHSPGEYFPTMLDIVGKVLYSGAHQRNNVKHSRNGTSSGDVALGAIVWSRASVLDGDLNATVLNEYLKDILSNSFASYNLQTLTKIANTLERSKLGTKIKTKLELRYYNEAQNVDLEDVGASIISWLESPQDVIDQTSEKSLLPDVDFKSINIKDAVEVIRVWEDGENSPSAFAISSAKRFASQVSDSFVKAFQFSSADAGLAPKILNALNNNIVDVWVTFEEVDDTLETSKLDSPGEIIVGVL